DGFAEAMARSGDGDEDAAGRCIGAAGLTLPQIGIGLGFHDADYLVIVAVNTDAVTYWITHRKQGSGHFIAEYHHVGSFFDLFSRKKASLTQTVVTRYRVIDGRAHDVGINRVA